MATTGFHRQLQPRSSVFLLVFLACLLIGAHSARGQVDVSAALAAIQPVAATVPAEGDSGVDLHDDPLPAGAVARLGTTRYRHDGWYKKIAFLADSRTFAVGTSDNTVRLWDAPTGRMIREIALGDARLQGFALSRDGKALAVLAAIIDYQNGEYDTLVKVWELPSWTERSAFAWHESTSESSQLIALSPDATLIAIGTHNGKLRIWDTASRQEILSYALTQGDIESMDYSPNGKWLAAAGRREVFLWDWLSGEKPKPLPELPQGAQVVRFSPDGSLLAVGDDDDRAARLYETSTGKLIRSLRGKSPRYYREGLDFFAAKSQLVVPTNRTHAIEFFDLATGELVRTLDAGILETRGVAVSLDGRYAAAIGSQAEIKVWDLETGELLTDRFVGHAERPYEITYLPGGQQIATGAVDGTIRVWDAQTGRLLRVLRHDRWVAALAASPNGSRLLSSSLDDSLRLWNARTGEEIYRLAGHGNTGGNLFTAVAFMPDGKTLLSFGSDLYLRAWDARTGKALAEHAIRPSSLEIEESEEGRLRLKRDGRSAGGPGDDVWMALGAAEFSADGRHLYLCVQGGRLHVFDVETGKEIETFEPRIEAYALAQDGSRLAALARKVLPGPNNDPYAHVSELRLLRLPSKKTVWQRDVPGSASNRICMSPDGQWIALSLFGRSPVLKSRSWISVYATETGREAFRIERLSHSAQSLVLSSDGRHLAASCEDSSVLVWDLEAFRLE